MIAQKKSSIRTILFLMTVYSICHMINVVEGRFLWDLSLYCVNYCSRNNGQMPAIGVCSCHRITSYHRRMTLRDPQLEPKENFPNSNNEQDIDNATT